MNDIQVRGYMVLNSGAYLRETLLKKMGEVEATRVMNDLSPGVRQTLATAKSAGWYPMGHMAEIVRTVASLGEGNEEKAKKELEACGRYIANEATNTFLRLLMRMLTPSLFAKKLPDFWKRDCTGGKLVVDVDEQRLVCKMYEMEGFDHVVVTTVGYVSFALEAMGKVIERSVVKDWSLQKPWTEGTSLELYWKK